MVDINCWFFTENFENELLSYFNNSKKDLKESRLSKIGPAASSKVITSKETIKRTIKQTNNKHYIKNITNSVFSLKRFYLRLVKK